MENSPTEMTSEIDDFSKMNWWRRRILERHRILNSEWEASQQEGGSLVLQLRYRAKKSQFRASLFLALIFLTVIFGLTYFVGIPLYQEYLDRLTNAESAAKSRELEVREANVRAEFQVYGDTLGEKYLTAWSRQPFPQEFLITDVFFADKANGWAVGVDGVILFSSNGGQSWERQPSNVRYALWSVHFTDLMNGWVVGDFGTVLNTTDGGQNWSAKPPDDLSEDDLIYAVATNSLNEKVWIGGSAGGVWSTEDHGENWRLHPRRMNNDVVSLNIAPDGSVWAVGTFGTVASNAVASNWRQEKAESASDEIFDGFFVSNGKGVIVGQNGKVLRSNGLGAPFLEIDISTNADLNSVHFYTASNGWIAGADGYLSETRDGGASWRRVEVPTSAHISDVFFFDETMGWIATNEGVWIGTNELGAQLKMANEPSEATSVIERLRSDGYVVSEELERLNQFSARLSEIAAERSSLSLSAESSFDRAISTAESIILSSNTEDERAKALALVEVALKDKNSFPLSEYTQLLPAGVLVLFLLAILNSLYRYHARVVGFYHGRADALQLAVLSIEDEKFERMAASLAADKVDFKETKGPIDAATELAKEAVARR